MTAICPANAGLNFHCILQFNPLNFSTILGGGMLAVGLFLMAAGPYPSGRQAAIPFKCGGVALICHGMRKNQEEQKHIPTSVNDLDAYGNVIRTRHFASRGQAQGYINYIKSRQS